MKGLRLGITIVVIIAVVLIQWRLMQNRRISTPGETSTGTGQFLSTPAPRKPLSDRAIGLVVGHWYRDEVLDVGAVCERNGELLLTELEINEGVAALLVPMLEEKGAKVWKLQEIDPSLRGFTADLVLSIHADSCVANTGFKAAHFARSGARDREQVLIKCLQTEYATSTNLVWDAFTITPNMTHYHVHEKVHLDTPSVILEMGFIGGDQRILTAGQDRVAEGILNSIMCMLDPNFVSDVPADVPLN